MNLDQIREEIDDLLNKYKEDWMSFVFKKDPNMALAVKEKQVYEAMLILSILNTFDPEIKEPIIYTEQKGWDLKFKWRYLDEENNLYEEVLEIPWEGEYCIVSKNPEEGFYYSKFTKIPSPEIGELGEFLKSFSYKENK